MRERFVSDGPRPPGPRPDPALPLSVYMHALGGTGMTAYGGLLEIGALKDGEQVFVSTAGGAVGSVAAQIAKIKGCYVVGSTGSDDKAAWLRDEAGLDAVINYKTEPLARGAGRGDAQGHRRLFRERRRRPPRRGPAAHERPRPHPGLRHDLDLQRRRRGGERPLRPDLRPRPHAGLRRRRLPTSTPGLRRRHDRLAEGRPDEVPGDDPGRLRARARRA